MKPRCIPCRTVLVMAVVLCCGWPALPGLGEEEGPFAPQSTPAPPSPAEIPLSEIAARAAKVANTLQSIQAHLAPSKLVQGIEPQLADLRRDKDQDLDDTSEMLRTNPTLEKLQAIQKLWQGRQLQTAGWLKTLTGRANEVKNLLDQVGQNQKTWIATREAVRASHAPEQVLRQVDGVITSLEAARMPLEEELRALLDLQAAVARELSQCESISSQIAKAQQKAVGGLLTRDSPAIWSTELWGDASKSLSTDVQRVVAANWREVQRYVWGAPRIVLLYGVLLATLAILFGAAGRRVHRWDTTEWRELSHVEVFDYPWSAAYLVSIIFSTSAISSAPETMKDLLKAVAFVPIIRLAIPLGAKVNFGAYIAGVLFAVEVIRQIIAGTPLLEQSFLIMEMVAGVSLLGWVQGQGHFKPDRGDAQRPAFDRFFPGVISLFFVSLVLGLFAGVLGYMQLARMFASTILGLGFLVLLLYSCFRILMGLTAFSLSTWPLKRLIMVQHHRDLLIRRAHRTLVGLSIFAGLFRSLDHLGLFQPALTISEAFLTAKIERGELSLSLGDVLSFFLTVWVAYLLSAFIRFILQEDVYPRLGVPVGLSYAASSLLNYIILTLGVFAGLAVLGMDLTKVTVLAGALGVGIGFGLQSVVNNFVSGLILLFERPIHVGDNIEVGEHLGEVRRIGIRASIIRNRQGAEVIIPNAQLVTDKVTNWTLSDQLRRIDLSVGVNYGAPPQAVIKMLENVARAHPRIMRNPAPHGLLLGFGDSSLSFELRAWTDEFADWVNLRSDLAVAVHDAILEAGWTIPFPQREVRLLNTTKE